MHQSGGGEFLLSISVTIGKGRAGALMLDGQVFIAAWFLSCLDTVMVCVSPGPAIV